jgi:hypothetical protein
MLKIIYSTDDHMKKEKICINNEVVWFYEYDEKLGLYFDRIL